MENIVGLLVLTSTNVDITTIMTTNNRTNKALFIVGIVGTFLAISLVK